MLEIKPCTPSAVTCRRVGFTPSYEAFEPLSLLHTLRAYEPRTPQDAVAATETYARQHLPALWPLQHGLHAAYDGTELVGAIHTARPLLRKQAEITLLAVRKDRHGQGIGSLLLESAENALAVNGVETVNLDSVQSAIGFYAYNGYRLTKNTAGRRHAMTKTLQAGVKYPYVI